MQCLREIRIIANLSFTFFMSNRVVFGYIQMIMLSGFLIISGCSGLRYSRNISEISDEIILKKIEKTSLDKSHFFQIRSQKDYITRESGCNRTIGTMEAYNSHGVRLIQFDESVSSVIIPSDSLASYCRSDADLILESIAKGDTLHSSNTLPRFSECMVLKNLKGEVFSYHRISDYEIVLVITWSSKVPYSINRLKLWTQQLSESPYDIFFVYLNMDIPSNRLPMDSVHAETD